MMIYMADQREDKEALKKEDEEALKKANKRWDFYDKGANRAHLGSQVLDILLLLVTAATTLAAAVQINAATVQANRWVTASLAASSVVVSGLRKIFNWNDTFVRFSVAASEVRAAIDDYELIPQADRNFEARKTLFDRLHAITQGETSAFAATYRGGSERG
jgi:hypothetical protein